MLNWVVLGVKLGNVGGNLRFLKLGALEAKLRTMGAKGGDLGIKLQALGAKFQAIKVKFCTLQVIGLWELGMGL